MNQNENFDDSISIKELLYVLKKNIILLCVIVLLMTAGGFVYAKIQIPKYTAQEEVFFKAQNISYDENNSNMKVMVAYLDTVKDFCIAGVVLDRADFYYDQYLYKKSQDNDLTVNKFIQEISKPNKDTYVGQLCKVKYFSEDNIKVHSSNSKSSSVFAFRVCYTEESRDVAIEKVKILVFAIKNESVERIERGNINSERKYFSGVNVEIMDEGLTGVTTDFSKTKTILLFVILGVLLGVVVVFIKHLLDNTIKTKEELERLTGFNVLSVIISQEGEK